MVVLRLVWERSWPRPRGQRPGLRTPTSDPQHRPQTQPSPNQAFSVLGDVRACLLPELPLVRWAFQCALLGEH